MAEDYGIKITKAGADVSSTNPDDFVFRSDIQSLPLIEKVTVQKTITSVDCEGTLTYTHNLGFFALPLVFVTDKSFGNRQILPFNMTELLSKLCSSDRFIENFSYKAKLNSIDIEYDVKCVIPMVGESCPPSSVVYTFDIYIYMFELGS